MQECYYLIRAHGASNHLYFLDLHFLGIDLLDLHRMNIKKRNINNASNHSVVKRIQNL